MGVRALQGQGSLTDGSRASAAIYILLTKRTSSREGAALGLAMVWREAWRGASSLPTPSRGAVGAIIELCVRRGSLPRKGLRPYPRPRTIIERLSSQLGSRDTCTVQVFEICEIETITTKSSPATLSGMGRAWQSSTASHDAGRDRLLPHRLLQSLRILHYPPHVLAPYGISFPGTQCLWRRAHHSCCLKGPKLPTTSTKP